MAHERMGISTTATVSFVITSRDEDPDTLARTIEELQTTVASTDHEIVIVDDGSQAPVTVEGKDVVVIRNPHPRGVSRLDGEERQ